MSQYKMPYVEVGMNVWWYADGDRTLDPFIAVVTVVGPNHVSLGVLAPGYSNFMTRDGVRHVDDKARAEADNEEGAWEHTPLNKALLKLAEAAEKQKPASKPAAAKSA